MGLGPWGTVPLNLFMVLTYSREKEGFHRSLCSPVKYEAYFPTFFFYKNEHFPHQNIVLKNYISDSTGLI